MPRHTETRRMPYTPEQSFDLVADVKRYQEFLPWVAATRVRSDSETLMIADLVVGFKAIKETFTSRVDKQRPTRIHTEYIDGPLKYLQNSWVFRPDGQGGRRSTSASISPSRTGSSKASPARCSTGR